MLLNSNKFNLDKTKQKLDFELMLTAIEENSGYMINLATIKWGKHISMHYSSTRLKHPRTDLNLLESYCRLKES